MTERRVVVTGIGTVNPLGADTNEFWKNSLSGISGIHTIEGIDTSGLTTKIAGQVSDFR